jgi:hypothetical protein
LINKIKKNKIIEFATEFDFIDLPSPARLDVPQWWKDGEFWLDNKLVVENYSASKGMKQCIPFFDPLISGYLIKTWTDILVEFDNNVPKLSWASKPDPINIRLDARNKTIPTPIGCYPDQMVWQFPFFVKTPPGYSCIITHPFNRHDLPFLGLTGIVDTDSPLYPGNYPFFLKHGFTGVIPKGTPIAQIIPFKRDDWKKVENKKIIEEGQLNEKKSNSVFSGFYKKNFWKKKKYE